MGGVSNGVGMMPEAFVAVGAILYAWAGLELVRRTALRIGIASAAVLGALVAVWWATSLIEYTAAEPLMSHALSFFCNALFLWVWTAPASRNPSLLRSAALGGCAALVALVRWQEGLILLLPLGEALYGMSQRHSGAMAGPAILLASFCAGFSPQLFVWHSLYGSYLTIPQGESFMHWTTPQMLGVLLSPRHGLLLWHPVTLLMLVGLVPLWRIDRRLAAGVSVMFLSQWYVNAAAGDWYGGDSFGGRRFIGLLPWLAVPLATWLGAWPRGPRAQRMAMALCAALVLWNGLSFVQYRLGFVARDQALTLRELTIDRLLLPFRILDHVRQH